MARARDYDESDPYPNPYEPYTDPYPLPVPGPVLPDAGTPPLPVPTPPPPAAPPSTNSGAGGDTGAGTYDLQKLRTALLALGGTVNSAALKAFINANQGTFAKGVTVGGSKGNKLYGPDGKFLADVIRATDGPNPSWAWDEDDGSGGGGNAIDPSYLAPWNTPFQAPAGSELPVWTTPENFSYADFEGFDPFVAPTADSILADPSYQFRRDQMVGALENSAAARGVLNSGGTLWDLLNQTGNFASQEYGNIWNRDFGAWNQNQQNKLTTYATNRDNAADAWTKNYTAMKDAYTANTGRASDIYDRAWQDYLDQKDSWYRNQDSAYNKLYPLAQLGAGAAN